MHPEHGRDPRSGNSVMLDYEIRQLIKATVVLVEKLTLLVEKKLNG